MFKQQGGRNGIDGLQPSLQDRVYDSNGISTAITTSQFFMPNYLIRINNNETILSCYKMEIENEQ